jgi:hypothetical protein
MTMPFTVTVNSKETELELELHFRVIRGRCETMVDPAEPDSAELDAALVIPHDPYFKRGKFDTPVWLWQIIVDDPAISDMMLEYAMAER